MRTKLPVVIIVIIGAVTSQITISGVGASRSKDAGRSSCQSRDDAFGSAMSGPYSLVTQLTQRQQTLISANASPTVRLQVQIAVLRAAIRIGEVAYSSDPCSATAQRLRLFFIQYGNLATQELSALQTYRRAGSARDEPTANRAYQVLLNTATQMQTKSDQINQFVASLGHP
jgi:hypothetical protein